MPKVLISAGRRLLPLPELLVDEVDGEWPQLPGDPLRDQRA